MERNGEGRAMLPAGRTTRDNAPNNSQQRSSTASTAVRETVTTRGSSRPLALLFELSSQRFSGGGFMPSLRKMHVEVLFGTQMFGHASGP